MYLSTDLTLISQMAAAIAEAALVAERSANFSMVLSVTDPNRLYQAISNMSTSSKVVFHTSVLIKYPLIPSLVLYCIHRCPSLCEYHWHSCDCVYVFLFDSHFTLSVSMHDFRLFTFIVHKGKYFGHNDVKIGIYVYCVLP
jgi:hypothetical protein